MALFAVVVIGSGLVRFLFHEGGEKGLGFGLVMGGMGLIATVLLGRGCVRLGLTVGAVAMAFVAGWFSFETFVVKGLDAAEGRQLIVIAFTLVTAVAVFVPRRKLKRPGDAEGC